MELRRRFNETFWCEELNTFALALDADKRRCSVRSSNAGHALFTGIADPELARRTARTLMDETSMSGWGIRTIATHEARYNPMSYHNGSVWPHDNALIALGFRRYGFVEEAGRIARDISGAAAYFMSHQMPELYSGLQREPTNFPVQYQGANVPQAWAAGSCFALLEMMVGFQPDAPAGRLYLDPALPDWLGELTVRDLHVGRNVFDLHFRRDGQATRFEVLKGDASAIERRSYATASERWT
jgi:glycogen debranching enzyme